MVVSAITSIAVVFGIDESDDVPVNLQPAHRSSLRLVQLASGSNEPGRGVGAQQDFGVSASVKLPLVASAVCSAKIVGK